MSMLFKRIKDWATSITAFRTGDVIPVDGPDGTAKMTKDSLLQETAQSTLAGNLAPAFDPTRTSENPYLAGQSVMHDGVLKTFKVNHYGSWADSDAYDYIDVKRATDILDKIIAISGGSQNLVLKPDELSAMEVGNLGSSTGLPSNFTNALRTTTPIDVKYINGSSISFSNDDTLLVTIFFFDKSDSLVTTNIYNNDGVRVGSHYKNVYKLNDVYKIKLDSDVHHVRFALQRVSQTVYDLDFATLFSFNFVVQVRKSETSNSVKDGGITKASLDSQLDTAVFGNNPIAYKVDEIINFDSNPICTNAALDGYDTWTRRGQDSFRFTLTKSNSASSITINLSKGVNKRIGVYLKIPPSVQAQIYRLKVTLLDAINTPVYTNYNFGVPLYTDVATPSGTKRVVVAPNGIIHLKTATPAGNGAYKLKLEFTLDADMSLDETCCVWIDNAVLVNERIKPVFLLNFDNAYSSLDSGHANSKASDVYAAIENAGLKYTICGPSPSQADEQLHNMLVNQVKKGILEIGTYAGLSNCENISDVRNAIETSIDITLSQSYAFGDKHMPSLLGCQFQYWDPRLFSLAKSEGFGCIRGGGSVGYNGYQFFGLVSNDIVSLIPNMFSYTSEADIHNYIDRVIDHASVALLFAHDFADENLTNLQSSATAWLLTINYLGVKQSNGECIVLTAREFCEYVREIGVLL